MSQPDEPRPEEPDVEDTAEEPAAAPPVNRRKIWLFSIAAVVVLVVAGVVVYLLTKGDSTEQASGPAVPTIQDSNPPSSSSQTQVTPPAGGTTATITAPPTTTSATPVGDAGNVQSVAEQAATAISNADVKTLAELSCDPSAAGEEDQFPTNAKVEVIGEPQVDGDTATITVRVTIEGVQPTEIPMPLTKRDGRWCIP